MAKRPQQKDSGDGKREPNITVSPVAYEELSNVADKLGMTKKAVAERVFLWLGEQPDALQRLAVGNLPQGFEVHVMELAIEKLKQDRAGGKPARSA